MSGWKNFSKNNSRRKKKQQRRRFLKLLQSVKVWQLSLILLIFVMLAAIFLRLNNIGMIDRRIDLIEADKTGEISQIKEAALSLQNYVARHMNTATGRVALQTLYDQEMETALAAAKPPEISEELYNIAQDECRPVLRTGNVESWMDCIAEKSGIEYFDSDQIRTILPDAFYIEFISPVLSFDAAGITVIICFLIGFIIIFRIISVLILRVILKIRYKIDE